MITTVSYWTLEALALWAYYILMRRCFPEKELDDEQDIPEDCEALFPKGEDYQRSMRESQQVDNAQ